MNHRLQQKKIYKHKLIIAGEKEKGKENAQHTDESSPTVLVISHKVTF